MEFKMTKITRRQYDQGFKVSTVEIIEREGYGLTDAAVRFGVSKSALSRWKNLYGDRSVGALRAGEVSLNLFEQKQLKKELDRVRRERDILKEALAYFAVGQQK